MKFQSGNGSSLRRIPVGVAVISLVVLFALLRVDFEASRISPQQIGEAQPNLEVMNTTTIVAASVEAVGGLGEKVAPALVEKFDEKSVAGSVAEVGALVEGVAPAPVEKSDAEPVEEVGSLGSVAEVGALVDRGAPAPEVARSAPEVGALVDKVAPAVAEESDDWDPGWGDRIPVDEAELLASEEEVEETEAVATGPIEWRYDVCLLVKIGRRGSDLPYAELYRLFNAVKGAPNGSEPWKTFGERRVLVGADFADILCLMVRDELGADVECTNYNRFGVKTNQCKHLVLGATKKYTPQPSPDELKRYSFLWNSAETVNLDIPDPVRQPPTLPMPQWRPTIVTGFTTNHVEAGLLLLRSLGKAALEQTEYNVSAVVWTMGEFPPLARRALACVVKELETVYGVQVEVRRFDFEAWPRWMRVNQQSGEAGEYAWKAVMMHTVLLERGFVFWADAGDRFRTVSALTTTLAHIKRKGFASRYAGGFVRDTTHVKQLEYFAANRREITNMLNCDTASAGFTLRKYTQLARPWYECSITRQCIAPDGSSRENHRQDQSALTILAALAHESCEGVDFFMDRRMDRLLNSHSVGVNATECYVDPLNLKWT